MNLFNATQQWATRPADERFWTLDELLEVTTRFHLEAVEAQVPVGSLRVGAGFYSDDQPPDLHLIGPDGSKAGFTNYSFGQLCQTARAPANYLRSLPPDLAATNLNHGLTHGDTLELGPRNILLRQNGGLRAHAIVSPKYGRIWNHDVVTRCVDLQEQGWKVPGAMPSPKGGNTRIATVEDESPASLVKAGMTIGPAGLYASDRDMFVFMISDVAIQVPGMPPMFRGFFVSNSEVGDRAFRATTFLFSYVCFNHIVWGARDVVETRVVHVGEETEVLSRAMHKMATHLGGYLDASPADELGMLTAVRDRRIGRGKEEVVTAVRERVRDLPAHVAVRAYDLALQHPEDGHRGPDTVLGMAQGLTRASQELPYANRRESIDRIAGRLLRIKF